MTSKTVTSKQLAAEFRRATKVTDAAVDKVLKAAAYAVRADAYQAVDRSATGSDNDPRAYAARQIQADPVGPGEMQVGYHNSVAGLAAQIEHGSSTMGPGGQLAAAAKREAPILERVVPLAAIKAMRGS